MEDNIFNDEVVKSEEAIKSQLSLFSNEFEEKQIYTNKIKSPIYTPSGIKPYIIELRDKTVANKLIEKIKASSLLEEEKAFLIDAAQRHITAKVNIKGFIFKWFDI